MAMTKKTQERINRLVPEVGGIRTPRYLRLYDNRKSKKVIDNYTAVFTGNYQLRGVPKYRNFQCNYIGFNGWPTSPNQGFWQHGSNNNMIDRPKYSHLGKKIKFQDLPEICRRLLMEEYCEIWDIPIELAQEV